MTGAKTIGNRQLAARARDLAAQAAGSRWPLSCRRLARCLPGACPGRQRRSVQTAQYRTVAADRVDLIGRPVLRADHPGAEVRAQGAPVLAAVLNEDDLLHLGRCPAGHHDRRLV